MAKHATAYLIRCLHTDASRPPLASDPIEVHWRCTAVFERNMYAEPPDPPYCPYHRRLYRHEAQQHRLPTVEEKREIVKGLTPKAIGFLRGVLPPESPILNDLPLSTTADPWTGIEKEKETPERLAAADARKHALRQQAQQLAPERSPTDA